MVDDDFDITIYNHQSRKTASPPLSAGAFQGTGPGGGLGGRAQKQPRPVAPVALMLRQRDFHRWKHTLLYFLRSRVAWYFERVLRHLRSEPAA